MKHLEISIRGRVQGVSFRYYTHRKARELDILGYVQNEPDGSVLIRAEGEESVLNAFVAWCHQGPSLARVTSVEVGEKPVQGLTEFEIRR